MFKIQAIALITALLCVLCCAGGSAAEPPYTIDVILSLTGGAAFVGGPQRDALEQFERLQNARGGIQGHPIHFDFHDDASSPQVAVQLMNGVIARQGAVVIGPSLAATCRATVSIVQSGPLEYCLSPSLNPTKGSYLFSAIVSTHDEYPALMRYLRDRGWTRIAMLSSTDATGQDADDSLASALSLPENSKMQLVAHEHFNTTDVSAAAQFAKIKAASPQVLIAWSTGAPFATLLHGIADAGIDLPVVASPGNMTYAQMKQYVGILPKELLFASQPYVVDPPIAKLAKPQAEFRDVFSKVNVRPDLQTGIAWDPANLIILALRKLGPSATATQVRDYLQTVRGYVGISGVYDFRDGSNRGLGTKDTLVVRWDEAKTSWVTVSQLGGAALR
jgi:branched-chain amino acid transport system substrate-binding protein